MVKQQKRSASARRARLRVVSRPKRKGAPVKPAKQASTSNNSDVVNVPVETLKYGNSLCEPDKFTGVGAPVFPSLPTQKATAFARGVLTVGSGKYGFAYVAPEQGSMSDAVTGAFTDSGFAGSAFSGTATPGSIAIRTNAQYLSAAFGAGTNDTRSRLVSSHLRVRYIGPELQRGGTIVSFQHPQHESLTGLTMQQVLAFKTAKKTPVTREWTTVHYCPLNYNFITGPTSDPGFPDAGDRYMGILVESTAGNEFEWEFFANYEYIGVNVRGKTLCPADPIGISVSQTVMNSMTPVSNGNNSGPSMRETYWNRFKEYLTRSVTWVGGQIREAAVKAIPIVAEAAVGALAAV